MIHLYRCAGDWEVWTDTDDDSAQDGRCIASETTKRQAIASAITELEDELQKLRALQKEAS